ncbi:sensor histidine kinase [Henriciella litoralis]|uniref:sensor histidine kinase n=1 Tax=Henriciella litoralis TaxID=568102 RepID=UPI00111C908B|nr:GAF domain-containing protein [Henriciella litoralis]
MKESARLAALYATNLLDSEPDPRFDRLTRLAANSLEVETALVSLIDTDRQWFKSCYNFDGTETQRDIAFCDYAIRANEVMIVLDAAKDPRFADNPLVTGDPFIRFYAGAPLITKDGHALGTLCVIDTKPRETFDDADCQILEDLAASVMAEIEAHAQRREVEDLAVVVRELEHRMGNMYAHVSSLISLLDKSDVDHDEFVRRLRDKISALGITQSLISANSGQSVSIRQLTVGTLEPFSAGPDHRAATVQTDGDFDITPRAAFALSLMVNELATNSIKHGALGTSGGKAHVSWSHENDEVKFIWRESLSENRPESATGSGFGNMILNRIVPKTFGGESNTELSEDTYTYSVTALPTRIIYVPEAD